MINSKDYDRCNDEINWFTEYKYYNYWLNKEKRLIAFNFYGEEPHGGKHPVHWILDETSHWVGGGDEGNYKNYIVPHNKMHKLRTSRLYIK